MRPRATVRRLLAFALSAAIVLGLVACGGGGSSTTSGGGDTAASTGSSDPGAVEQPRRSAPHEGAGPEEGAGSQERGGGQEGEAQEGVAPRGTGGTGEGSGSSGAQGGASGPGPSAGSGSGHGTLTRAGAKIAGRRARRRARAAHRRLAREAGAAAPFLVETGDNSIPTYGSEASAGESAAAEASLSAYLTARAGGGWAAACARMSAQLQRQLALLAGKSAGEGCPAAYATLAEGIPPSARADPLSGQIAALRVESPHAFALFYGPGGQQYMMPLEEEGGGWKVTQLEPVPWPIGSTAR